MFQHLLRAPPLSGRTSILEWPLTSQEASGIVYHEGLECAVSATSFVEVEMPGHDEVEIGVKLVLGTTLRVKVYVYELNLVSECIFDELGSDGFETVLTMVDDVLFLLLRVAYHWKRFRWCRPVVKSAVRKL